MAIYHTVSPQECVIHDATDASEPRAWPAPRAEGGRHQYDDSHDSKVTL